MGVLKSTKTDTGVYWSQLKLIQPGVLKSTKTNTGVYCNQPKLIQRCIEVNLNWYRGVLKWTQTDTGVLKSIKTDTGGVLKLTKNWYTGLSKSTKIDTGVYRSQLKTNIEVFDTGVNWSWIKICELPPYIRQNRSMSNYDQRRFLMTIYWRKRSSIDVYKKRTCDGFKHQILYDFKLDTD